MKITFDRFCREVIQCEHYVEWDYMEEVFDHGRRYEMEYECCSCELVGESHNVDAYNEFCPHQKAIKLFEKERIKEMKAFEKECERIKIWERLNDTT